MPEPAEMSLTETESTPFLRRTNTWVYAFTGLISAALMAYALTISFVWDEGFHVVAAQLILHGKTPYLDFCFPQTPLNAYWNAAWMRVFGENWRVLHIPAALEISAAMFIVAHFLLNRFPVARWRAPLAIAAACFIGLHAEVVQFGPIAQAYAAGMLLVLAGFRIAVARPDRPRTPILAFFSGLLSSAAACGTLLTAPAVLVLFLWFCLSRKVASRLKNAAGFILGALIPVIPVLVLFAKSPRVVFFNIVQYQAMFRRVDWPGATTHDVDVLSAWLADTQTLILGALFLYGVYFVWRKSNWPRQSRVELYLAAAVSLALVLYIATAHPTFARYFIVAIPVISVLSAVGLYAFGARITETGDAFWPTTIIVLLMLLGYGRGLFQDRDSATWQEYEEIAAKIKQVTPKNGVIYADELVYFILKQPPPPGMEFSYSHKLELPPAEERLYHIVSEKELDAQVAAGRFDTVESCNDDRIDEMRLDNLFAHKADVKDCSIYWGKIASKLKPAKK
jgi:hypothetical protein